MKIKRFLAACMALTLSLGALTGCGNSSSNTSADRGEVQGSADATDVNVGLIMGPPSMGLGWLIHENEEGNTFNHYNFDVAGVDYSAVSASLNQGDYDIATVPSNVAAILYNNPDMKEKVKVISATVAALRLDAVAAAGYGVSRSRMADEIKGQNVKVNWKEAKNAAQTVSEGDIISFRSRGRVEVAEIRGTTKKGRLSITLKRYI